VNRARSKTVREDARAWVLRLEDAHTPADRKAFQQWLGEDAAHQSAYDQVLASYQSSGVLRASEIGRRRDLESAFPRSSRILSRGLAIASIAAVLVISGYAVQYALPALRPMALQSVMLSTGADAREVTLADGSRLSMAPASEVSVEIDRTRRLAEIRKGRVRLIVAPEQRPFRITAGASSAEAASGIFDARMIDGQGLVQAAAVPGAGRPINNGQAAMPNPPLVRPTVEFSGEPLQRVIERINETGRDRKIELDPGLRDLRVTGILQQGDSETMARSLALSFGLKATKTNSGAILLAREK
jgi:transmembrane sensor